MTEMIRKPNGIQSRSDLINLLLQVVIVTILVAQEVIIWIIPAVVPRILLNKLFSKDLYGILLVPKFFKNNPFSRLGKCKLSQVPTTGRTFAHQVNRD